jgi:cytidine deaminase
LIPVVLPSWEEINIRYERHEDPSTLTDSDRVLLEEAKSIAEKAYAPYSRFKVGAAIRLSGISETFSGNNQENVAYPSGLCAERVALFHAKAHHPDAAVEAIAIYAIPEYFSLERPITPCGACRQALLEYEHTSETPCRVVMGSSVGTVYIFPAVKDLLPLSFFESRLGHE